jgi:hypothetical protein
MKTICFDLDGVICSQTKGDYENAVPNMKAIALVNALAKSNKIIIHTARFMGRNNSDIEKTHKEGYDFTMKQLKSWGVDFHELIMGKPRYDIVVDDKAVFYTDDWEKINDDISKRLK